MSRAAERSGKGAGAKVRVLIVDDDAGVRNFLQMVLEVEGYEVEYAADGKQALAAQRQNPAAVVVTDIFMPEAEGIETIVKLREEFPGTGIIVMSGGGAQGSTDYLALARELGAAKALKKPFAPQELIDAVREVRAR
jgi:DNA-binding response OmpR family regulator